MILIFTRCPEKNYVVFMFSNWAQPITLHVSPLVYIFYSTFMYSMLRHLVNELHVFCIFRKLFCQINVMCLRTTTQFIFFFKYQTGNTRLIRFRVQFFTLILFSIDKTLIGCIRICSPRDASRLYVTYLFHRINNKKCKKDTLNTEAFIQVMQYAIIRLILACV